MTATYDEVLTSLGLAPSTPPTECGTYNGYARHRYNGETPCDDCRAANAEYKRRRYHAPKDSVALPPINHGTPAGAQRHWYRGETPCDACRAAYNAAYSPAWTERRRARRRAQGGAR
jgi:hypothetical protein